MGVAIGDVGAVRPPPACHACMLHDLKCQNNNSIIMLFLHLKCINMTKKYAIITLQFLLCNLD